MKLRKIICVSFIYPIPLTDWVSNIILVMKKHGPISVCIDYRDVDCACPKDKYPNLFIDQIVDDCASGEIYSFMDGFSRYNQINILPADQTKISLSIPEVHFPTKNSHLF